MNLQTLTTISAVGGVRLLLTTASPLQGIIDRPSITHEFCNLQAVKILRQDGLEHYADWMSQYMNELNAGVLWADEGWRNVSHYFHPITRKGLWQFSTAWEEFGQYMARAGKLMRRRNVRKAMFFLGAAAHLVQDMCVPHHTQLKMLTGHKQYETWAKEHYADYGVNTHGIYREGKPVRSMILHNALISADLLQWVQSGVSETSYHKATAILLPLAQRTTAGLFLQFCSSMGQNLRSGSLETFTVA